ncbi:MAG: hypothetical protein ACM3U2_06515 [Deltaproteobacteria bacterium]
MPGNKDPFSDDDMLLAFDSPAFIRRAMQVEAAWDALVAVCRRERERLLEMPRMRLARFLALSRSWPAAGSALCRAEDLAYLKELHADWQPRLRTAMNPPRMESVLARALADLARSFLRFNRRWRAFLGELDLRPINQLREGYNRYYLLEKECALRSARLAREGFVPLPPVRIESLIELFPLLNVPEPPARA